MDTFEPVTGDFPVEERLPLLTLAEAQRAVALLLRLADGTAEGREADHLAHDLAARLPVREQRRIACPDPSGCVRTHPDRAWTV